MGTHWQTWIVAADWTAPGGTWQALGQTQRSPGIPPGLDLLGLVGVGKRL